MVLDYHSFLGRSFEITIDRPVGSVHPKHPDIIYPINYGYVDGIIAEDDEEVDVYVLGAEKPAKKIKAKIIAIIHRLNDDEDKLVASVANKEYSDDEIEKAVEFQEKYYMHLLIRK